MSLDLASLAAIPVHDITTWTSRTGIPDRITEVYTPGLTWQRDTVTGWWQAVAPDGERLSHSTEALLEIYGRVTSHREVA